MKSISLPWGAWYYDTQEVLKVSDEWQVDVFKLRDRQPLPEQQMRERLRNLTDQITQKKPDSVVIVVDDLTRPVYLGDLLRIILNELNSCGISRSAVTILIGLGAHRPLTDEEMAKKLGREIQENYTCVNHKPEDTVPTGEQWGKTELKLNRHFLKADFKIVISGLTPHSFAGFSGGAKMLIPGISDMEIISKTHKSVLMGFMGKLGDVEHNRFRNVIESLIREVGIDYFVGVVLNGDRTIADIYCGDYIEAHRKAAIKAREQYRIDLKNNSPYDLVILNAFPKDTELLQAENGFIPLKSAGNNLVKEGGVVVLTSACSEGMGYHGLFGPGGLLYRSPRPLRFLKDRHFAFYSPNLTEDQFFQLYSEEYAFFREKDLLMKYLENLLPQKARVAVFPFASLQLVSA
ncbi:MAG: DUF2088 domain-containing protein [Calditrichaeota bacterium]|nr:DUF2088 domain-containing protein [Calditrichota bacterium]